MKALCEGWNFAGQVVEAENESFFEDLYVCGFGKHGEFVRGIDKAERINY